MMEEKAKILIADDNEVNLYLLNSVIKKNNFLVYSAKNGRETLDKLKEFPDIDLVILDIQMPFLTGFEVAREMKANPITSDIPIIFITGLFVSEEFVQEGYEIGAFEYMEKPVDTKTLINKINVILKIEKQKKELRQQAEEIKKKNEFINLLIQNIPSLIITLDYDVQVIQQNTLVELYEQQYQGFNFQKIEKMLPNIKRCIDELSIIEFESTYQNEDTRLVFKISIIPLNIRENTCQILISLQDITERKQTEEELKKHRDHLEDLVKQRTRELEKSIEELKTTNLKLDNILNELQKTQSQLVQSEKMVALGNLIAGVAHEINSPLGAIKSQNDSVERDLENLFPELLLLMKSQPQNIVELMIKLVTLSADPGQLLTVKEERTLKLDLIVKLKQKNIPFPETIAALFANFGSNVDINEFEPLLKNNLIEDILSILNKLINLKKSNRIISEANERIIKIIKALKLYSHGDPSQQYILFDITEGINAVLTLYHYKIKQGIELNVEYLFKEPIKCYPDELNQIWTNLLNNSMYAMDFKGKINIKVEKEGNYVVTTFADTGKGIPDEIKEKIFEPFFTSKPIGEGTGLGLDIVKNIITKHNGLIELESKVGVGTTFKIKLPVNRN
ncbi:MAG: domain S-box [Ignavibacteria bacterium]|nr:domain S-box [Ignavibacteria bacterium]